MTRRCVWVLACLLLPSCAARRPAPELLADIGKAQTLVAAGCYSCLADALAIYERAAASPRAPADVHNRAFESALLLAVRSRELGIPDEVPLAQARALASRVPAPAAGRLSVADYLAAAELTPVESSGFDPEQRERRARERRAAYGTSLAEHAARIALTPSVATDPVAAYLAIAIDCDDARARKLINAAEMLQHHGTTLIRYRLAMCALGGDSLASFRQADPRWQDTLFFEGRREMTRQPIADMGLAAGLLAQAHQAFPTSVAMTMGLAAARNSLSEYDVALALYDSVLANAPTHRDALLGRIMSLSYLTRHLDAIASATQMIELGTWHIGDAHYWRAWNRYQLSELDPAWSDIERATQLNINSAVFMLAGVIVYARKDLDTAISRLQRSHDLDKENCEAVWTESLVHVDKQAWALAAPRFALGVTCFALAAAQARREIEACRTRGSG